MRIKDVVSKTQCIAKVFVAVLVGVSSITQVTAQEAGSPPTQDRSLFEIDGATFVTFYDLPSRRFRAIREAF